MARMRMKKLEEYLSGVDDFEKPKIKFEQYPTPPHIASCVLYNIQVRIQLKLIHNSLTDKNLMQAQFGDLEGKLVGDLGSGCGMLSIGAFLLGSQLTVGFELDADAIDVSYLTFYVFKANFIDTFFRYFVTIYRKWNCLLLIAYRQMFCNFPPQSGKTALIRLSQIRHLVPKIMLAWICVLWKPVCIWLQKQCILCIKLPPGNHFSIYIFRFLLITLESRHNNFTNSNFLKIFRTRLENNLNFNFIHSLLFSLIKLYSSSHLAIRFNTFLLTKRFGCKNIFLSFKQ